LCSKLKENFQLDFVGKSEYLGLGQPRRAGSAKKGVITQQTKLTSSEIIKKKKSGVSAAKDTLETKHICNFSQLAILAYKRNALQSDWKLILKVF